MDEMGGANRAKLSWGDYAWGVLIGIMPGDIHLPGRLVLSLARERSPTKRSSENRFSYGQSTCVGIGGDPIPGVTSSTYSGAFKMIRAPRQLSCGEIGGNAEEEAAEFIKSHVTKPQLTHCGVTAPPGKRMGHGCNHCRERWLMINLQPSMLVSRR